MCQWSSPKQKLFGAILNFGKKSTVLVVHGAKADEIIHCDAKQKKNGQKEPSFHSLLRCMTLWCQETRSKEGVKCVV